MAASETNSNRAGNFIKNSDGELRRRATIRNRLQSAWNIGCTPKNHHNLPQLRMSSELDLIFGFGQISGLPSVCCIICMCGGEDRPAPRISTEVISITTGPMVFIFCRLVAHVGTATWCNMNGNGGVAPDLASKTRFYVVNFHNLTYLPI